MIIGIGGWERCLKTGFGVILACNPSIFNIPGFQDYNIRQGFGNLHVNTPYPWTYLCNKDLITKIRNANINGDTDTLFFIDEADDVYNPRFFTSKEQTNNLKGIGQHAKNKNVYVYTYQMGQPEDSLLGVDKILRSNTRIDFEMRYYDPSLYSAIYIMTNRMTPDSEPITGVISDVDLYYDKWDTRERVC